MSEIGDILQKATQVLDTKGWCQNSLYNDHTGGVCAYGAINIALTGSWLVPGAKEMTTIDAISDTLYNHLPESYKKKCNNPRDLFPCGTSCIVEFNNDPHTTVADIKDLFAKTIADEGISIANADSK